MTEIHTTIKNDRVRISLNGHALHNPGNDIVCAGISAITCTLMAMLENMSDRGDLTDLAMDVNEGFVIIDYRPVSPDCKVVLEMAEVGYMGIADAYPENCAYGCTSV